MLLNSPTRQSRLVSRSAFTLLEILVVMAIIVTLAGAGTYYLMQYLDDAKVNEGRLGISKIDSAVQAYKVAYGEYPSGLEVLTQKGEKGGPYLSEDEIKDPMKQAYGYAPAQDGSKPTITATINGKAISNKDRK